VQLIYFTEASFFIIVLLEFISAYIPAWHWFVKVPPWWKSGSCIRRHSRRAICTSSFLWTRQPPECCCSGPNCVSACFVSGVQWRSSHVSSPVNSPVSTGTEFLNSYLDGTDASMRLGIMLKNNYTLLEQMSCLIVWFLWPREPRTATSQRVWKAVVM